eukprot:CAMPEP_0184864898 /NCGR_PEP_ID=MMETSP0580-20130426/16271_1 /TAXON_ID=1118495 /ORGANISM="Dactyliosolen fragilissimus" /LENGTH=230 /DNA_ID=CAMNT_0027363845 /DNA_START=82 /DNA_END=774 /DNA_ORIENTATION=-
MRRNFLNTGKYLPPHFLSISVNVGSATKPSNSFTSGFFYATRFVTASTNSTTAQSVSLGTNYVGLKFVKEQGTSHLEAITSDMKARSSDRLLAKDEDVGPSPRQKKEAERIKVLIEDAIEVYISKTGGNSFCCVGGDPIVVLDVEVSSDLRRARIYWTLPFGLLTMRNLSSAKLNQIARRVQEHLDKGVGFLKVIVHGKLSSYHRPPDFQFVHAEGGALLDKELKELLNL